MRKVHHKQLFRRIAHGGRIVDDEDARRQLLEQMRRGDIAKVERRILPQQHDIGLGELEARRFLQREIVARPVAHGDFGGFGGDAMRPPGQLIGGVVVEPVAALFRLQHQGERRIAGEIDFVDRIHLDRDNEGHNRSFRRIRLLGRRRKNLRLRGRVVNFP